MLFQFGLASEKQVEIEGLTGDIRFNEDGRRTNYTLSVVEMSSNSDVIKVGEWSDQYRFKAADSPPDRVVQQNDYEKNRTYVVTTILEEPYIMKNPEYNPKTHPDENDKYIGYCKDLASTLAARLGIKCTCHVCLFFFGLGFAIRQNRLERLLPLK